jgi:poly-gamma-glutamate synthesis protein (capsule biosynthesis protein)
MKCFKSLFIKIIFAVVLTTACSREAAQTNPPGVFYTPTATPFRPLAATPRPGELAFSAPAQSASAPPESALWLGEAVPNHFRLLAASQNLPLSAEPSQAAYSLDYAAEGEITWIYALAAAFPTVTDDVPAEALRRAWHGDLSGPLAGRHLIMAESTLEAFTAKWGPPDPVIVSAAGGDWVDALWFDRSLWAILPFEDLQPQLKVISLDGNSPLRNDFDPANYPLIARFTVQPSNFPALNFPTINRDPAKLTTLVMTGVTALVRATANKMEVHGLNYPAGDILDWLAEADITHISNEIPFAENCPTPTPYQDNLQFCSSPRYIDFLEHIGTDVVELTGNHFMDWGRTATLLTVEMYDEKGWPYYGGGADLMDSMQPAFLEHNGNRFAFIGCNPVGPGFAWATDGNPGAAPCGDYTWIKDEITRLKGEGYTVIATMQYNEYYVPWAPENQVRDFAALAEAGATIVSGSQSHYPQVMAFYGPAFIHYGLGNLFFDQMFYTLPDGTTTTETRLEFLDRHVFYDGRYLATELLTAVLEDFARPRPMTPEERGEFLLKYFEASGW